MIMSVNKCVCMPETDEWATFLVKCVVSIFKHFIHIYTYSCVWLNFLICTWVFVCVDELMCKHTSLHGVADDRVNS